MRLLTATGRYKTVQASSGFLDGDDTSRSGVSLVAGPDGMFRTLSYVEVYRANPWLWAVVQLIARGLARMPIKVYREDDDDTKVRVRPRDGGVPGSLARALRRPGEGRSWQALQHATTVDRLVHGNAVWFPERDRRGEYTGFRRIPFKHARHDEIAGVDRYWDARKPNAKRLADDVVHFGAALDCDDLWSPSPIAALQATLALYDAVERHLTSFFKNSARPSGHLEVDKATKEPAIKLIREELTKLYTSPENAGKVLVTSGKWSPVGSAPDHTKVIELAKQAREEIVGVYGVPPPLVGILDRAIMSNVRELRSHYARDVAGPHAVLFEGDIDAQVLARDPRLDDVFVEFEMAAFLRPDLEARAATWKDQRYVRTLNEIRATESLTRIDHPDADIPWMPLNEAPLGGSNAPADDDDDPPDDPALMTRTEGDDDGSA